MTLTTNTRARTSTSYIASRVCCHRTNASYTESEQKRTGARCLPRGIVSDRDSLLSLFTGQFWDQLHKLIGVDLRRSSAYHLQTERTNRTVGQMLRQCVSPNQKDWSVKLVYCHLDRGSEAVSSSFGAQEPPTDTATFKLSCTSCAATRNLVLSSPVHCTFNNVVVPSLSPGWLRVVIPLSSNDQGLVFQGAQALCPHSRPPGHCAGLSGFHSSTECRRRPSACHGDRRGAWLYLYLTPRHVTHRIPVRDRRQLGTKATLPS